MASESNEHLMDWTLEVVILPVSDIDRSIVFGDLPAQRQMEPGSMRALQLCVADAHGAAELISPRRRSQRTNLARRSRGRRGG